MHGMHDLRGWQISPTDDVRMVEQPSQRGVLRRMLLPGDIDGLESPARGQVNSRSM
jgi:hypothetical protein